MTLNVEILQSQIKENRDDINNANNFYHELDKSISLLKKETHDLKSTVEELSNKIDQISATQADIYAKLIPDVQKVTSEVTGIKDNILAINKRHEREDHDRERNINIRKWLVSNWRLVVASLVVIVGAYEGGKQLYYMPSPKYNTHEVRK